MSDIYEYLAPLHQGIWEVIIPKDLISDPLGSEWKFSPINIPSRETIASYRNGQYHLHETNEDYRIHLDRYDPDKNPLLHLIDDAPLILMIFETLQTLYMTARDAKVNPGPDIIKDQRLTWKFRIILGIILLTISGNLVMIALNRDPILFSTLFPAIIFFSGFFIFINGLSLQKRKEHSEKDIVNGVLIMLGGVLMVFLWELYLAIILFILAIWFFGSAYATLKRVIKEKKRVTQGLWLAMGLGMLSLLCGGLTLASPDFLLEILVHILAIIIGIIGIGLLIDGYGLRNAEQLIIEQQSISKKKEL